MFGWLAGEIKGERERDVAWGGLSVGPAAAGATGAGPSVLDGFQTPAKLVVIASGS